MSISKYELFYLLINIFSTYIVYSFAKIFFKNNYYSKKGVFFAYFLFYLATSFVYIYFSVFVVNIITTLLFTFIITLCYKSKLSIKIIVTFLNYLLLFTCEAIVAGLIGLTDIDPLQNTYYGNTFSLIIVAILEFSLVKLIGKFKDLNSDTPIPWSFFLIAILVTIISVLFEILLFMQGNISEVVHFFSSVCILLLNFLIFYLYDSISKTFNERINAEILQQKKYQYQNQAKIIQQSYESTRQLRHDIKNHTIVLSELIRNNENEKALEYVSALSGELEPSKIYCNTGIISIDSIVNYKFTKASEIGIMINSEIAIPYDLNLLTNELVAILGNLLDNAIEASCKAKEKYINFRIQYDKGTIIIIMVNSFDGNLKIDENNYKTTKQDDLDMHGIGLNSVKAAIEKYNGEMHVNHTNTEFSVKILLMT